MPIAIVAGDLVSARAWCTLANQASVNTFNHQCITVTGAGCTDQDYCNAVDAVAVNFYGPWMTTHSRYDGIQAYILHRATGGLKPAPVSTTASSGAGTALGDPMPPNTAAVLKYNTNLRGPGGRGRVYLPFAAVSWASVDGTTTNAADVLINSFASALLNPLVVTGTGGTATFVWELLKKHKGADPTATGQIINAFSAAKFGQMHKRGSYGRPNESPI